MLASRHELFEEPENHWVGTVLSKWILFLITGSITALILETDDYLREEAIPPYVWKNIELVCTAVFSVEFAIRFLVCDAKGGTRVTAFLGRGRNPVVLLVYRMCSSKKHISVRR